MVGSPGSMAVPGELGDALGLEGLLGAWSVPKSDETTGVGRMRQAKGTLLQWGPGWAKGGRVRPLSAPGRFDE